MTRILNASPISLCWPLAVSCLFFITSTIQAHFTVTTWETDQGLPENSATSMIQDHQGFLWFGTFNGLVRFDGISFKIFDRSNLPELPSPAVVKLHFDQQGRLWVCTVDGVIVRENDQWFRYDQDKGWQGNYVRDIAEAPDGTLYFSTFDGHLLRFAEQRLDVIPSPPGKEQQGLFIHVDPEGRLWALDSEFFGFWDSGSWNNEHPLNQSLQAAPNYAMAPSREGFVWVVDDRSLRLLSTTKVLEEFPTPPEAKSIWSLYEDRLGNVWIASFSDGLVRYRRDEQKYEHLSSADHLSHDSLRFVFEDSEGHVWIGSSGGGLMKFHEPAFDTIGTDEGLNEPLIKSVAVDLDERVMAATFGGGFNLMSNDRFTAIPGIGGNTTYIQSVLVDRENQVWAGTLGQGLYQLNNASSQLIRHEALPKIEIRASFEARDGTLWFGGQKQAYRLQEGQWTTLPLPTGIEAAITCFAQSPNRDQIYAGTTTSGLLQIKGEQWTPVSISDRFDQEGVASLLFLDAETLLIGTFDLGLVVFKNQEVTHIDQERGFPGSGISSITHHKEALWIGTNRGIVRILKTRLEEMILDESVPFVGQVFTQSDGLSSIECPIGFQPTAQVDQHGRIWFASGKGINRIKPSQLELNRVEPSIVFEEISYLDDSNQMQLHLIENSSTSLQLPPEHSNVTIKFTSPTFASPEKIMFETSLSGTGSTIRKRQNSRDIHFHRLAPGDYQISVRVRNSDGFWSKANNSIRLSVAPYYWQKPEFQISTAIGVIGLTGAAGFWLSRRQIRRNMKHLESELRLKRLLEQTQNSAAIGGWEYDSKTQGLYWTNEAFAIHDQSPSQFKPRLDSLLSLYHEPHQNELRQAISSAVTDGKEFSIEAQLKENNEWLQITGKVAHRPTPKVYGCFQNINEQKVRAEKEREQERHRRQSQKLEAIGTLAGGIAHDFNNILTGIRGYTDLLDLDLPEDPNSREHVNNLKDAAGRASDLVKQILTYSRPSSERLTPLDLTEVTRQALKLLRASIPASIEIESEFKPEIPLIQGSESQIHQLLLNLVTNAAQAIGDLGAIRCRLSTKTFSDSAVHSLGDLHPGEYAVLEVTDTGKGMSRSQIERIFDPFFTTKHDSNGTGLGLSVVLGIVKNHKGAIRLVSETGQGTTFRVYFPTTEEKISLAQTDAAPPKFNTAKSILLIDDDEAVLDVTARILKSQGHTTATYASSPTAIEAFEQSPAKFDLVITDLSMPSMRGDQVIEHIRSLGFTTPIILISGNLENLDATVIEANGVRLLTKPYQKDDLLRAIAEAMSTAQPAESSSGR